MKRALTPLLTLLLLCLSALFVVAQSPNVTGEWEVTINSPQGSRTANITFKQEGEKLSGSIKRQGGELPFEGMIKGKEIKFTYTIKFQDNDLAITLTGDVEGDSIKGTADFGGFAQGDWTAKRLTAAASAAQSAGATSTAQLDVSGSWNFEVETDQGSGSPTFTFKQEGEKLTGQYKGLFGEAPLTGSVKGNQITFSFKVSAQGMEATITYTGTIESQNTMKGTAKLGDLGSGTWTAKRQP
jgi:hypothetical protein